MKEGGKLWRKNMEEKRDSLNINNNQYNYLLSSALYCSKQIIYLFKSWFPFKVYRSFALFVKKLSVR